MAIIPSVVVPVATPQEVDARVAILAAVGFAERAPVSWERRDKLLLVTFADGLDARGFVRDFVETLGYSPWRHLAPRRWPEVWTRAADRARG